VPLAKRLSLIKFPDFKEDILRRKMLFSAESDTLFKDIIVDLPLAERDFFDQSNFPLQGRYSTKRKILFHTGLTLYLKDNTVDFSVG
jgi:hypothetical protein